MVSQNSLTHISFSFIKNFHTRNFNRTLQSFSSLYYLCNNKSIMYSTMSWFWEPFFFFLLISPDFNIVLIILIKHLVAKKSEIKIILSSTKFVRRGKKGKMKTSVFCCTRNRYRNPDRSWCKSEWRLNNWRLNKTGTIVRSFSNNRKREEREKNKRESVAYKPHGVTKIGSTIAFNDA